MAFSALAVKMDLHSMGYTFAKGGGELFVFRDSPSLGGLYQPADELVKNVLASHMGDEWRPYRADSVLRLCFDSAPVLWESPPLTEVNVQNGIIDTVSGELRPHSPTFRSPIQLRVNYDPTADCPRIRQFVAEVFPGDAQILGYEIAGWLCVPEINLQKAVLLLGAGANGKSTYLNLLTALLGQNNVSRVPLHDFGGNRFKPADLYGKLANLCGDLPPKVGDSAMFKMIVGGDSISAERKYGHPFAFTPFCRLVFSANELLDSSDFSLAFLRRWVVVPFPNTFDETQADEHLLKKLTTSEELSGLFNMALAAYSGVRKRGSFTQAWSTSWAKSEFEATLDPIADFLAEWTILGTGESVPKPTLYSSYAEWAKVAGQKPISRPRFKQLLQQKVPGLAEKAIHGTRYWTGIGLVQQPINLGANLH